MEATQIMSLTLVNKICEFIYLTPKENDWSFEAQIDNPPRLIRLKQIDCLINLFVPEVKHLKKVKSKIKYVINGNFIVKRNIGSLRNVISRMEERISWSIYKKQYGSELNLEVLQCNYAPLFKFKIDLAKFQNYNSSILNNCFEVCYIELVSNDIINNINSDVLDSFLSEIIDTENRTYDKSELISIYNYPSEDLFEIDCEWV